MTNTIKMKNSSLGIFIGDTKSKEFAKYGRTITGFDFSDIIVKSKKTVKMPETGTAYERSIPDLESLAIKNSIQKYVYGDMPIQIGWCIGWNNTMNSFEYHKGSEVITAVTPIFLLVGSFFDIKDNKYDSSLVEGFYLAEGETVELFASTLHFAPMNPVETGFVALITLPEGTNAPIERGNSFCDQEARLLWMRNKWMICHPDSVQATRGAFQGIIGENVKINF